MAMASGDVTITGSYCLLCLFKYGYDVSVNVASHEDLVNGVNYRYIYDVYGRLVKIVDSKGNIVKYNYDVESNLSSFSENLNGLDNTTSYTCDKATNTIYHFEYARKAMGALIEIFKK